MNEQEEAKTRLKKQQQEIDHMKLRYLAAEEKQVNILPGKTVRQRFIVYSTDSLLTHFYLLSESSQMIISENAEKLCCDYQSTNSLKF